MIFLSTVIKALLNERSIDEVKALTRGNLSNAYIQKILLKSVGSNKVDVHNKTKNLVFGSTLARRVDYPYEVRYEVVSGDANDVKIKFDRTGVIYSLDVSLANSHFVEGDISRRYKDIIYIYDRNDLARVNHYIISKNVNQDMIFKSDTGLYHYTLYNIVDGSHYDLENFKWNYSTIGFNLEQNTPITRWLIPTL